MAVRGDSDSGSGSSRWSRSSRSSRSRVNSSIGSNSSSNNNNNNNNSSSIHPHTRILRAPRCPRGYEGNHQKTRFVPEGLYRTYLSGPLTGPNYGKFDARSEKQPRSGPLRGHGVDTGGIGALRRPLLWYRHRREGAEGGDACGTAARPNNSNSSSSQSSCHSSSHRHSNTINNSSPTHSSRHSSSHSPLNIYHTPSSRPSRASRHLQ
mmetsp:Transcript_7151/g.15625  ORF Transcript_7151/g.15625 Transcript_7151/m.15625 type:complete len:208 (+) Transcript_7151:459-1082(+)